MQGKTHLAVGALTGCVIAQSAGIKDPWVGAGVALAAVAALIPDWLQINIPGLNKRVKGIAGHRGFTHWLITAWVVSWAVSEIQPPSWGLPVPPGAFVLGGWLSHIALDALSSGVPALWPLPWRVTLARVRTGGGLDSALGQLAIVAQLVMLLRWILDYA